MLLKGAQILIECLKEQGVDTIFGYPGGAVLDIYDALYEHQDQIRHILTSHEQGAVHAADGYARATGKVGVCLATSGPGATNLVTGLATAYMDSVPLVAITGNVPVHLLGKDSFQEVDIAGITMPITKHNYIVRDADELASTLRKAFYIAQEGRPGPVLVDIPRNVTVQTAEYRAEKPKPIDKRPKAVTDDDISRALEILTKCKRPCLYIGGGVIRSEAADEVLTLAERLQAPVSSTLMGLGGFPADHELYMGIIGMHGTQTSHLAVIHCDLLIAIGARFSDRVTGKIDAFAPEAQIIQIDIDPAEINKNVLTHHHIVGDIKEVLKTFNAHLEPQNRKEWINQIKEWKKQYPLQYVKNGSLKPQYIIEKIHKVTEGKAIITTEVGQNQMWTAQYYPFTKPRTFISSGGLGTMGFGLGACIGAQLGRPEEQVINIAGDGSFIMNSNELATAVAYGLPIIVVILNNHVLGMVRQWQSLFCNRRYSQTALNRPIDFIKLAESYGAVGFHLTREEDVEGVLRKALEIRKPVVINCEIDKDDKVLPMVPPGATIQEMIT